MSELDPRQLEIVHAAIDGEDVDAEGLEQVFSEAPEALQLHRDLGRLTVALSELEALEPPAELRAAILAKAGHMQRPRPGFSWNPLSWLVPLPVGYALTFVVGLVAGAGVLNLASDYPVEETQITGAMGMPPTSAGAERVDQARLAMDALQGSVDLAQAGRDLYLRFSLIAEEPVSVFVDLADAPLEFRGIHQSVRPIEALSVENQRLALRIEGENQFLLTLHGQGTEVGGIRIGFLAGDRLLQEVELRSGH